MKSFRVPAGGGAAPVFGPPGPIAGQALVTGNLLSWTAVAGAKYMIYRRSATDKNDPQNLNNPWAWQRMTAAPIVSATYMDVYARELESYEYKVWSVDVAGTRSTTSSDITLVSASWAPQNHLCHWSEDLSQTGGFQGWIRDTGVTVSGSAGSQTLTFSAAAQAISQRLACYPLNGRTYTYFYRVTGTAGQKIQFFAHDDELGSSFDFQFTLTGGTDDVVFTRTFTTNGRRMRIGINTFGTGTDARVLTVRRCRVAAGNLTAAQIVSGYERTQGPGTTWCEPLQIDSVHVTGGATLTVNSWHRSYDANVQTFRVRVNTPVVLNRVRSFSRGFHVTGSAGDVQVDATNSRFYGLNPMAANKHYGRVYNGDYAKRVVFEDNFMERTSGIRVGIFKGRTDTQTVKIRRNLYWDIDGRYVNADGSYVQSSYGSSHGTLPGNAQLGFETAQIAYLYCLQDPGNPTALIAPFNLPGVEIAWNECVNRPGFSRHEDLINLHAFRGTESSPIRIHHNRLWGVGPWDWHWHLANNRATAYNYGKILTTYTLNGSQTSNGPDFSSGTAILLSDLFSFDPLYIVKNSQHIESYSNLVVGPQGIISVQAGSSQSSRDDTILSTGSLMEPMEGAVVAATTHRRSGIQYTNYSGQDGYNGFAFDHTTVQTGTLTNSVSTGATTVVVSALTKAAGVGEEVRISVSNSAPAWGRLTVAAATGATSLTVTGLNKGASAGATVRIGVSETIWSKNTIANTLHGISGLPNIGYGNADAGLSRPGIPLTVPTPAGEWVAWAEGQALAATANQVAGAGAI